MPPRLPATQPILIRLAWHDSGTYSVEAAQELPWPRAGGATASIRFKPASLFRRGTLCMGAANGGAWCRSRCRNEAQVHVRGAPALPACRR